MNPLSIIQKYYPVDTDAYHILVVHSRSVADKALAIAKCHPELDLDLTFIEEAAMLHDIGIFKCDAEGIGCHGDAPYICHGYLGAELMREEGFPRHALVCERHTGTGLSLKMIEEQNLPVPHRDMRPVSWEEQIICFVDKFYSKTHLDKEKSPEKIRKSLEKFGEETVKQFDPIYLSHSVMDEALWNGEIKGKWLFDSPTEWPSAEKYEENVEGAVECFKSIKRKYYFENEDGVNLFMLQPGEIKRCTEIFTSFETQKKQIKERIIRGLNKLFLPSSDDKKLLRIWTTHRYDLSVDAGVAISSRYIDASELEIKMPKPNDWMKGMEYVPNHVLLKPHEQENPVLILDVDFLRTLDAVEAGYPIGLLAPQYEQTAARFLRQLDDYNLTEDNDDGEIIIANRKKSYKKSIYVIDNKYSFEEED